MHPKWERVLADLWKVSRFASYFYQGVALVETSSVPTLALGIAGQFPTLFYSASFVDELEAPELMGLLVHELLHVAFSHDHRSLKDNEPGMQNLAQDMVVNSYLEDHASRFFSGEGEVRLPDGLPVIPKDFFEETGNPDPTWEEVHLWFGRRGPKEVREFSDAVRAMFRDLKELAKSRANDTDTGLSVPIADLDSEDPTSQPDLSGIQLSQENNALPTGTHLFQDAQEVKKLGSHLVRTLERGAPDPGLGQDRLFEAVSRIIGDIRIFRNPSWEKKVKSLLDRTARSNRWEYRRSRFSRRHFAEGIYATGRSLANKERLTVAIDVSASMTSRPGELEAAFGVLDHLAGDFAITLLCVDEALFVPRLNADPTKPKRLQTTTRLRLYKKGDWKHLATGNSGTTFFAPLFNSWMRGHAEQLLVVTDGDIHDLAALRPYPRTLWLVSESRKTPFSPGFGEVAPIPQRRQGGGA